MYFTVLGKFVVRSFTHISSVYDRTPVLFLLPQTYWLTVKVYTKVCTSVHLIYAYRQERQIMLKIIINSYFQTQLTLKVDKKAFLRFVEMVRKRASLHV